LGVPDFVASLFTPDASRLPELEVALLAVLPELFTPELSVTALLFLPEPFCATLVELLLLSWLTLVPEDLLCPY
jgi:hypothetical protein